MTTPQKMTPDQPAEQAVLAPERELRPPPRIRPVLDLATSHLPERYSRQGLRGQPGVIAYNLPYGWLLWVPADIEEDQLGSDEEAAAELLTILRFARERGCDYVLFDSDAEPCEGLPTWDW